MREASRAVPPLFTGKMPGIILNAVAIADLFNEREVMIGTPSQTFSVQFFPLTLQHRHALLQFLFNSFYGALFLSLSVMKCFAGKRKNSLLFGQNALRHGVYFPDCRDPARVQLNAKHHALGDRHYFHDVADTAKCSRREIRRCALKNIATSFRKSVARSALSPTASFKFSRSYSSGLPKP